MRSKRIVLAVGIILVLLGAVWAFQGAGMLGTGSFMDNSPTYLYLGSALAILGVLVLALGVIPKSGNQEAPLA